MQNLEMWRKNPKVCHEYGCTFSRKNYEAKKCWENFKKRVDKNVLFLFVKIPK